MTVPPTIYYEDYRLTVSELRVLQHLERNGAVIVNKREKDIVRSTESIPKEVVAVGMIPFVHAVIKKQGFQMVPPDDYPLALRPLLKRKVWEGKLIDVERHAPIFVKPRDKVKRFTGKIVDEYREIPGVSKQTDVWFSEIVKFRDEYRVFILEGEILGGFSSGGFSFGKIPEIEIDRPVVEEAIRLLGKLTVALDFGIIEDGSTALVEANWPYSLGDYGLPTEKFAEFLVVGYRQIQTMSKKMDS